MNTINNWPTKKLFSEDAITYSLYKNHISSDSEVFFKLAHNINVKAPRGWDYWCAPEVDVIEVKKDNTIIAYELKGVRRHKKTEENWPAFYDGIGQAVAYLNLLWIYESAAKKRRYTGGVFDFVYLVYPRDKAEFPEHEREVLDLLPIGILIALPDGKFFKAKEAPQNPLLNQGAKKHFLENVDTIEKHSVRGKIFRKVERAGKLFFEQ
ncbi:MAG: hypothetical protein NTV77_03485 [Candidatus Azambacteria bacterium]|nr:hypothetical protein [Candidatus Azambacteria bacterium]